MMKRKGETKANKAILTLLLLFLLAGCDNSLAITKIELGRFPDNIVYFVGESDSLDLAGGTLFVSIKSGEVFEQPISDLEVWEISDNVVFTEPGVYEVKITWMDTLVCRIPIQVIDRRP